MPSNLNALIRYKTIDGCLSNPYRKWSIDDLREACDEALREYRGTGSGISERTIREDIRVMRSDILGFNAPIVQSGGSYYYGDRDYSIFNVYVRDEGLLSRILEFMLEIRSEVDHPDLDHIIRSIEEITSLSGATKDSGTGMEAPLRMTEKRVEEATDEFLASDAMVPITGIGWGWMLKKVFPEF